MKALCALLLAALMPLSGCAIFNRDNTPLLNWFEAKAIPKKNPAKTLAYPVLIPGGMLAVVIDGVIVHPIRSIDDTMHDTKDICWDELNWKTEYVTECAALPLRVIGTPVIAVGSFVLRSLFDIEPNPAPAKKTTQEASEPESPSEPQPYRESVAFINRFRAMTPTSVSVTVLIFGDKPQRIEPVPQTQLDLAAAIIRGESWKAPTIKAPAAETLCWIVFEGPRLSLIVHLREQGLAVGPGGEQRFFNAELARMLPDILKSHNVLEGPRAESWQRAMKNIVDPHGPAAEE